MRPPVRSAVASHLRVLADRLSPHAPHAPHAPPRATRRSPGALVRLDGRWWYRGELVSPAGAEEVATDVQLRP